ncbi:MAG: hypothetical protein IJQ52_06085 [Bacteroidales bacterium]|nr:hypothetical protein [Bacteroidales bacterium]
MFRSIFSSIAGAVGSKVASNALNSAGQWFLVEIQYLSDIRPPAAEDKWR